MHFSNGVMEIVMKLKTIDQFLFPYQISFAGKVRYTAERAFEQIGANAKPKLFLIGIAWPALPGRHTVCIEPENGPWLQSIISASQDDLDARWSGHPLQQMFYGDQPSMRDKPENIRRLVVTEAIREDLKASSRADGVRSFVSTAVKLDGYYICIILQVPEDLLSKFPPVAYRWQEEEHETSFLLSCINVILSDAEKALLMPEPGRFHDAGMRSPDEIIREAAQNFMRTPFLSGTPSFTDLFTQFNSISRVMYEGEKARSQVILAQKDDPNINYIFKLSEPVPLRNTRWARKLLQMGAGETPVIAGYTSIFGIGQVSDISDRPFKVDFLDQQQWDFRRGEQVLLRTRFGDPSLPQEPIGEARFLDNFKRIFPGAGEPAASRFRLVLDLLLKQPRGSMLVVAEDAAAEAKRLGHQGTLIEPVALSGQLLDKASRIDGTIIADPQGVCHAIGVILDGEANSQCTPSRGARYNSALRYVDEKSAKRLAFVISEDRTLDIIPMLRPRVSAQALDKLVENLEAATTDTYFEPRNDLDRLRFYLNEDQCARINAALARLNQETMDEGCLVLHLAEFCPHPEMNEAYLAT